MVKKIVLALCASILIGVGCCGIFFFATPTFHGKQETLHQSDKPHVLLVSLASGTGGSKEHFASLSTMLRAKNYPVSIIAAHNSAISTHFETHNIPHYTTHASLFCSYVRPFFHFILYYCMNTIYKKHPFVFIHCNDTREVVAAKKIAQKHPVKVLMTRHIPDPLKTTYIKDLSAVIGVNPHITQYLANENTEKKLNIKYIETIPPFFDQEKFLAYKPSSSRYDFFRSTYNIALTNSSIITMIANFYTNQSHKNHKLLIEVMDTLIKKEHYNIHVMLAGDGPTRSMIEQMVKEHHLESHVHFLGYTQEIPALLHHSDIMVLTSKHEALGIVYLEAGLMKKPAIGAYDTGAESVIIHEQTGLLFKNNDCADLVACLKRLLDDQKFAQKLGANAYKHVLEHFAPEITFKKYEKLYQA